MKYFMSLFNSFFVLILGTGIAMGKVSLFEGIDRWICGIGMIIFGILGTYFMIAILVGEHIGKSSAIYRILHLNK